MCYYALILTQSNTKIETNELSLHAVEMYAFTVLD